MKFEVLQENLARALQTALRGVSSKPALPVLSNLLLATDQGRLKLVATDLERGVIVWTGAKISQEGELAVPARILAEFVGNLSPGSVTGSVDGSTLVLEGEGAQSRLNGVAASEFPAVFEGNPKPLLELDPAEFAAAVSEVVFAAAADESRPVLSGALLRLEGETLTLAGVDGFRLSERKLKLSEAVKEKISWVVPGKILAEVARLASGSQKPVALAHLPKQNLLVFRLPDVLISARLLEGEFPDYRRIIPETFSTKAVFAAEDFAQAVRLASVFARDFSNVVKLRIDPSTERVFVSAEATEIGTGEKSLPAEIEGESLEIAFNGKYLLDLLSNLKAERMSFASEGSLNPGVLQVAGRDDFIHVVMPVRTQT